MESENDAGEAARFGPVSEGPRFSVERLMEAMNRLVRAKTVFGDPVERDGVTVIPVAQARFGFGGGGGAKGDEEGGGGGGGALVRPVGYIEIKNGESEFRPIRDRSGDLKGLAAVGIVGLVILRGILMKRRTD